MATNTPNLDLYKVDPATDGDKTFNVTTMLNENWDKIDAAVQGVKDDVNNIDLSKITPESIGAETPEGAQEKADAAAAASVPLNASAIKTGHLVIKDDAGLLSLTGATHVYQNFFIGSSRKGYMGPSDPANSDVFNIVSERGVLNLYSPIHVQMNGRNVLAEIDALKTSGVEAKKAIVDAINAQGGQASTHDDWATLSQKIRAISTGISNPYMLFNGGAVFRPDGPYPSIFTHDWAPGHLYNETVPGWSRPNVAVEPDPATGQVQIKVADADEHGRGQAVARIPVDLTSVGQIEIMLNTDYTNMPATTMITVGVMKNYNISGFFYDKYKSLSFVGSLGAGRWYTMALDTTDLTGTFYIGFDVSISADGVRGAPIRFGAVRLIQGR